MTRLSKSDAEHLIDAVDSPLIVDVLRSALARVLDVEAYDDDWPALVRLAGQRGGWADARVSSLVLRDPHQLVELALELNEQRDLT